MVIELSTHLLPIFSGTYETIWDVNEYGDRGEELNVEYDFKELMKSIQDEYQNCADEIICEFRTPWIKSIKFTGNYSPREYNFSTDRLDFELEIDEAAMMKALNALKGNPTFENYLKDHYTSYDGFYSFTPNNYPELYDEIVNHGYHYEQAMGALIRFVAGIDSISSELEQSIYDSWSTNGYQGLEYRIIVEQSESEMCPICADKSVTCESVEDVRPEVKRQNMVCDECHAMYSFYIYN